MSSTSHSPALCKLRGQGSVARSRGGALDGVDMAIRITAVTTVHTLNRGNEMKPCSWMG